MSQPKFTVRIDWLQFSVPREHIGKIRGLLCSALGLPKTEWRDDPHGALGYRSGQSLLLSNGARVGLFWTPEEGIHEGRPECHVRIAGSACAAIQEPGRWSTLLREVADLGASVSRLDLTGDDMEKSVSPRFVYEEFQRGAAVTHASVTDWIERREDNAPAGATFYLGSPKSERRLCVYDKSMESSQRIDAIRWELRCRNNNAQQVFETLVGTEEEKWGRVFRSFLVGFVDFREPDSYGKGNKHRRTRCEWFQKLVGNAKAARLWTTNDIDMSAVRRFITWMETTMASAIATYQQIMGGQSMGRLLSLGGLTQSRRHQQLAELARRFGEEQAKHDEGDQA